MSHTERASTQPHHPQQRMHSLDAKQVPLTGSALIEASAGTGKTYTIASLYLRYIVEQPFLRSDEEGHPTGGRELRADNILVVTFTRAATAELRDRIRQRLHLAVACFRGRDAGSDEVIRDLVSRYAEQRQLVLKRLYAAEKSMDEAAVFTIHSFCHQALVQNAFAAGSAAGAKLLESEDQLLHLAAEDFWRLAVYPLSGDNWRLVTEALRIKQKRGSKPATPANLLKKLRGLLSRKSLHIEPAPLCLPPGEAITELLAQREGAWLPFAGHWSVQLADMAEEQKAQKGARKATIDKHINAIGDWLSGDTAETNEYPSKAVKYVADKAKKSPELGLTVTFTEALAAYQQQNDLQPQLFSQALHFISQRLDEEKKRLGLLAPDDLMKSLRQALHCPQRGDELATALRRQYPVAMIDEFQDTDPLQFGIFSRLYQLPPPAPEAVGQQAETETQTQTETQAQADHAWLMIGDPKQSIYAFRGADIHTYVGAKQGTGADSRYTLERNYRSTRDMVEAVNDLFGYNGADAFLDSAIPYQPVGAQDSGNKGSLVVAGQPQPALTLWQLPQEAIAGQAGAVQCAEQIVTLLNGAAQGEAHCGDKPLTPGDIAVLVRDRWEAELVAEQLRQRQVRSVFLSRDSVYSTQAAEQLLRVVMAFNEPRNERLVMAALATPLSSLTATELAEVREQELLWQQHQLRFAAYHDRWQQQGILAAVQCWMSDYRVAAGLLADPLQGERVLADLLHCAELLQSQAMRLEGSHSLLRYFRQQLADTDGTSSDSNRQGEQRRLESDSNLVQIVTIHASKGLEYPVVMLPFALARRQARDAVYADAGQTVVDFHQGRQGEGALSRADRERLAEEVRLLYVALTRAVYACYLGLGYQQSSADGLCALDHLLKLEQESDTERQAAIESLVAQSDGRIVALPVAVPSAQTGQTATLLQPPVAEDEPERMVRQLQRDIDFSWRVTSYSAMSARTHSPLVRGKSEDEQSENQHSESRQSSTQAPEVQLPRGDGDPVSRPAQPPADMADNRFTFARGSTPGDALHSMLEHQHFAANQPGELARVALRALQQFGLSEPERWSPVVAEWLTDVLQTPLLSSGTRLADLAPACALPEMEFHLRVGRQVSAAAVNRCFAAHPLLAPEYAAACGELDFSDFRGMIKGFIDLTAEIDGRYYVCDYKSNYLGCEPDDYSQSAMAHKMASQRYDAQLVFYTLALHRYLRQQLADYDYERHIGGGLYLFLRGMTADNQGQSGVFYARPARELIESLDRLLTERQPGDVTDGALHHD